MFILRIERDTRIFQHFSIHVSHVDGPLLFQTSLLTWLFPFPGAPCLKKHPQTLDVNSKMVILGFMYLDYCIFYLWGYYRLLTIFRFWQASCQSCQGVHFQAEFAKAKSSGSVPAPSRLWQQCQSEAFRIQACQKKWRKHIATFDPWNVLLVGGLDPSEKH